MEIEIKFSVPAQYRRQVFSLEELGVTEKEWDAKSSDEKRRICEEAISGFDQPDWSVDDWEEK